MRTQPWIRFIGIVCVVIGAFGIFGASWGLSYMPFSELKMELSEKVPLHIIQWRQGLKYLALLVNIVYFIAGVYFLYKKSFSLRLMYFALAISILYVIVPMLFLNPYSNNPWLSRYSFSLFHFMRPIIDMGLLAGVFIISRKYYPMQSGRGEETGGKVNYRIPAALISGFLINLLASILFGKLSLDCLPYSLIAGNIFLFAGAALGFSWPSYSWKTGLWLIAPDFLVIIPLGMLSNWFALGWDIVLKRLLNCEIYYLIAILVAACLGSLLGSLLKRRMVL